MLTGDKQMIKDEGLIGDTIRTISGEAEYIGTEIEDSNERWNDNYYTTRGYYVIHEGSKHHVYKMI